MNKRLDELSKKSTLNRIKFSEESRNQVMQRISKKNRKRSISIWNKRILSAVTLMFLLLIPVYIAFQSTVEAPNQTADSQKVTPEKPPLENLENSYENLIMQDPEQLRVVNYDSKQELIKAFSEIMSHDLAVQKVDRFFRETDEELFKNESDGPVTVNFDNAYEITKISDKKYRLTQTQESELTGKIRLTITYQYQDDKWIIQDRTVESLESS
ncbi:hypothetical protein [Virgibacillus doumboii]|uniref:hypothetical protein n=1 Tax=Virgibacillus doumboii TaxID=2697503 RepID=UPI0013DEEF4E|nr:hypothetical protein [Virgibacillus doumboii]